VESARGAAPRSIGSRSPDRLGKYEIGAPIGRGARGVVYLAFDSTLSRDVAVKVLFAEVLDDPSGRERFHREARAAASLTHPHVVTVHDYGEDRGVPYIVMEYLAGPSIEELITEGSPESADSKIRHILRVCSALDFAHGKGIIHRDIKPSNLRFTSQGTIKVVDFGMAKLPGSSLTGSGSFLGTPAFAAPEVIRGEPIDGRADVFSLAATLYSWLAFRRPFEGHDLSAVLWKILNEKPAPLSTLCAVCPREIDAIMEIALSKNPQTRYPTIASFARDLEKLLGIAPSASDGDPAPKALYQRKDAVRSPFEKSAALTLTSTTLVRHATAPWGRRTLLLLGAGIALAGAVAVFRAFNDGTSKENVSRDLLESGAPERLAPAAVETSSPQPSSYLADTTVQRGENASELEPPRSSAKRSPELQEEPSSPAAAAAPPALPWTIPFGTPIRIRIDVALRSDRNRPGDEFRATVTDPVVVAGQIVVEAGAPVIGRVERLGHDGRPFMELSLTSIGLGSSFVAIRTGNYRLVAPASRPGSPPVLAILAGTLAGAGVGALAGGDRGAVYGAAAGAVLGANAHRPVASDEYYFGDRLTFKLAQGLAIASGPSLKN
jgi:serine/threonine protein kinase